MKKSETIKKSFVYAAGVFVYVFLVVNLISNANSLFGETDNFLTGLFMLLLLIISASVTGFLVLGKPIQLYLDGLKREGITLLFFIIGWLVVLLIVVALLLAVLG